MSLIVSSVLLPPAVEDAAFLVGCDARSPENRYAGWGLPAEKVETLRADMLPLSGEPVEIGALLVPAMATAAALNAVLPAQRAAVLGKGLLAALAEQILRSHHVEIETVRPAAALPLIVDTSGAPSSWSNALESLRAEGAILLLLPPASTKADFNFYPDVHRHSLRVIARYWHRLPPPHERVGYESLIEIISNLLHDTQWLRSLSLDDSPVESERWQFFNWATCSRHQQW
jgi:threonine dehydrogenase-like Zn-dependent dehydrogenase